jgi:hypothetical protein
MIVQTVIDYLQSKIKTSNIFEGVFGLSDSIVDSSGNKYPCEYIGNGKFKPININAFNGVVYFKKNGDVTNQDVTASFNNKGNCDKIFQIGIPLRVIAFKKKSELPIDCVYSDDYVAETLLAIMNDKHTGLRSSLNAMSCNVSWIAYSTNTILIWQSETTAETIDINTTMSCVAVDVIVSITIERNCIQYACQ